MAEREKYMTMIEENLVLVKSLIPNILGWNTELKGFERKSLALIHASLVELMQDLLRMRDKALDLQSNNRLALGHPVFGEEGKKLIKHLNTELKKLNTELRRVGPENLNTGLSRAVASLRRLTDSLVLSIHGELSEDLGSYSVFRPEIIVGPDEVSGSLIMVGGSIKGSVLGEEASVSSDIVRGKYIKLNKYLRPPSEKRYFYFSLEGAPDCVFRNQVVCGTEVELIFNYSVPPDDVLVQVKGFVLEELRKHSGEMDLSIIPFGFKVTDETYSRTAVFSNDELVEPVRFYLQAEDPRNETGVLVLFRKNGALLYELYVEIEIVAANQLDSIPNALFKEKIVDLDIEDLTKAAKRAKRDYVIEISSKGETSYRIQRKMYKQEKGKSIVQNLGRLVSTIERGNLATLLGDISNRISSIAEHDVFTEDEYHSFDPYQDPKTHSSLKECMNILATEGWKLYDVLSKDAGFRQVLEEVDGLRPGARVSIETVDCFIPWGILYPSEFNVEWSNKNADPTKFWGYRYLIEVLLIGGGGNYQVDPFYEKAFVSLNVNSLLEKQLLEDPQKGVTSHANFFKESVSNDQGELRNDPQRIKALFHTEKTKATFIYLYCHGSNEKPFDGNQTEALEFGPEGEEAGRMVPATIRPSHTLEERPLVFLNSCSSGAFSPLSLINFLTTFKGVGAEGLIVSEFPVPIRFGASFGQEIIRRYLEGQAIGDALMDIRRKLLERLNPLGLFYSLHCPLDLRTQRRSKENVA